MKNILIAFSSTLTLLVAGGIAQAHESGIEDTDGGSGYIVASSGLVLISGDSSCIRRGGWSEDNQINACEGIEEPVAAVEPEPEPEIVAAPPAPEPVNQLETMAESGSSNFNTNSADLTSEGLDAVNGLIGRLATFQSIESLTVSGHTDSRGSKEYNQGLSERRAQTVADLLSAAYPGTELTVSGLGESFPIDTNDTPEGRLANRRVTVAVQGSKLIQN